MIDDLQVVTVETSMLDVRHIWLTPDLAAELLGDMASNRKLNQGRVNKITQDIINGEYTLNPNPIVMDDQGRLIDGQHRCSAVVQSETPIQVLFARGFPSSAMDVIDTGKPRSAGDIMSIEEMPIANKTHVAAAAKLMIMYRTKPEKIWQSALHPSVVAVVQEVKSDIERYAAAASRAKAIMAGMPKGRGKFNSAGALAAALMLIEEHSHNLDLLESFEHGLKTGEMLQLGDPRLTIRTADHLPWGGGQSQLFGFIKTWNHFVREEPLKILRVRQSMLPMPKPE